MGSIKILIADDEIPARKKIISFLKNNEYDFVILEAANGIEACTVILEQKPDIAFLDIQMPGMTGLEVVQNINAPELPIIIFATAYDQYAIKAFEINALDYLLKPFDKERFEATFKRCIQMLNMKEGNTAGITGFINEIRKEKKYLERILVGSGSKYFFVPASDLIYLEADEKYILLHTSKGKHLIRETMNNMEEKLNPGLFKRIHRSFIVNVEFIQEMQPASHGDYLVILSNGAKINMSRRYKENLFGTSGD